MYVLVGGGFVNIAITKIFEMTGLINWLHSFVPKLWVSVWLSGTSVGIAFFLILFKKHYYKEPFFIKYPSVEEEAEMKARTKEENIKFNKVMSAEDSGNSSRPSVSTSNRTHNARGQ